MKFQQISAGDALTQAVAAKMLPYSELLRNHVEFYTKAGNAATSRKEQAGVGAKSRALGNAYTGQTLEPDYAVAKRTFIGDAIQVDVAYEKMGYDIPSEILAQLLRIAPGIADTFHSHLINGDNSKDAKAFNGLANLCLESQIVKAAGNGLEIKTGNDSDSKKTQQAFLEKLDETIAMCRGINKVVILNGKTLARLNTIAREYIQYTQDSFGKPIVSYNGTPLVNIEKETSAVVLPFTETCGTATATCSLFVTSFEEEAGVSFLTTPAGFQVYPTEKVKNFYETMVEFILDSILLRDKAISKLSGIIL